MIGKDFITAGAAVFTIEHEGRHYTYRVSRKDGGEHCNACDGSGYWNRSTRPCFTCAGTGETQPVWFVGLLTGPNNEADYTYMGILQIETGKVILTKASKYKGDSIPYLWLVDTLRYLWSDLPLRDGWDLHHEGRCGMCGRTLTVPESIESGIGPVCAGKI